MDAFRRRYFQMHFCEWKVLYFDENFIEVCSYGIGLYNGLASNRRQAVIWTNADLIRWRIYAALRGDELKGEFGFGTHVRY